MNATIAVVITGLAFFCGVAFFLYALGKESYKAE